MTDVPPEIVAETLVETLADTAVKLRVLAEGLDKDSAEGANYLADVIDRCSRIAAIANMQREELEEMIASLKT